MEDHGDNIDLETIVNIREEYFNKWLSVLDFDPKKTSIRDMANSSVCVTFWEETDFLRRSMKNDPHVQLIAKANEKACAAAKSSWDGPFTVQKRLRIDPLPWRSTVL